jgi:hypothetical protein
MRLGPKNRCYGLNEGYGWASPIVFGSRIPDFLSRFVALSKFMRLSLGESRTRILATAAK